MEDMIGSPLGDPGYRLVDADAHINEPPDAVHPEPVVDDGGRVVGAAHPARPDRVVPARHYGTDVGGQGVVFVERGLRRQHDGPGKGAQRVGVEHLLAAPESFDQAGHVGVLGEQVEVHLRGRHRIGRGEPESSPRHRIVHAARQHARDRRAHHRGEVRRRGEVEHVHHAEEHVVDTGPRARRVPHAQLVLGVVGPGRTVDRQGEQEDTGMVVQVGPDRVLGDAHVDPEGVELCRRPDPRPPEDGR